MSEVDILLVDDEDVAREGIADYLRDISGFGVKAFSNGRDLLNHLKSTSEDKYQVLLLDMVLGPPMNGSEVMAHLRQEHPGLPVIVFTGEDPTGGVKAFGRGAYSYLRKPIDLIGLENSIHNLVEQDRVLRKMAQDARMMLNSDICLAWRLNRQERRFQVAAWSGEELDSWYRQNVFLSPDDLATRKFFSRGQPLFLPRVEEAENYKDEHKELAQYNDWTSLISIPLVRDDQIVGLIDSYTHGELKFADDHERERWLRVILPAFAHQATEAVRNANLSKQLQTLQDINQILAGTFNAETAIDLILSKGLELVGTEIGWIYLVDNEQRLVLKGSQGIPRGLVDETREMGAGITGWVAQEKQALRVSNVDLLPKGVSHMPIFGLEIKSEIGVPLRREEQTIGVLVAKSLHPNAFTDDDLEALAALASQAAIVIGRTVLSRHQQRISKLALAEDFQELADYVVEAATELTGAEVALWTIDDKNRQYLRIAAHKSNFDRDYVAQALTPITPGESITGRALEEGRPIYRRDIQNDTGSPSFHNIRVAKENMWHSFMTVPLLGEQEQPLGSLSLYSKEVGKFSEPDAELMSTFANQTAIAFENFQQKQILEQINENTQALLAARESGELLQRVVDKACEVLNADNAVLYEYFEKENEIGVPSVLSGDFRAEDAVKDLGQRALDENSAVHYTIERDQPYYASNAQEYWSELEIPGQANFVKREDIISSAGFPLVSSGECVGVLFVNYRFLRSFPSNTRNTMEFFAGAAALAIERARLNDELEQKNKQLSVLREIYERIMAVGIKDIDKILDLLYEAAAQILDLSNAQVQIAFYSAQDDRVTFPLAVEQDNGEVIDKVRGGEREIEYLEETDENRSVQQFQPRTRREPPGLTEYVIRTRESLLIVEDFEKKASRLGITVWPTFGRLNRPTHSWLGVPMIVKGKVIGIISIQSLEQERAFDRAQQELLQAIANQAAVAIANARLLDKEKSRSRQLQSLQEIGTKITSHLKLEEVLSSVVESACVATSADFATLFAYDFERRAISHGVRWGEVSNKKPSIPGNDGFTASIASFQRPSFVEDVEIVDDHSIRSFVERNKVQSFAGVPLIFDNETVGVLYLNFFDPRSFSSEDKEMISLLSMQAAVAINNAHQFETANWAELGRLAGGLAHRIGNNSGTVRLKIKEVQKSLQDMKRPVPDKTWEALETAQRNNNYLLELSELVFKPFRASKERMAPSNIKLMLNAAIHNADIPQEVKVRRAYQEELPFVKANRFFTEVFLEVITNAVKAMKESQRKELTIRTYYDSDWVEISFTDTGVGIEDDRLPKIFGLFDSGDSKDKHFGFGLWWIRQFLRSVGGDIEVESCYGEGSTFTVKLPREAEQ
jgi:GAF domain-containing protein